MQGVRFIFCGVVFTFCVLFFDRMSSPPPIPEAAIQSPRRRKTGLSTRIFLGVGITAGLLISVGLKNMFIPASSMKPTLRAGSHLLIERLSYQFREPVRGEIVVFKTARIESIEKMNGGRVQVYIKRLAGLPGDTLSVEAGELYVNGELFEVICDGERLPFYPYGALTEGASLTVPDNSLFVLGDNSSNSSDSRMWGFVPRENLVGRYLFTYYYDKNYLKRREAKQREQMGW